ncbi:MAG: bifunctional UDP-N-acetylglucosamine diphosphorylase/glucosamine-1-phosphate N-acetyltransferase GlmU [Methylococcaceae bacterium]|nr:bifunctional UDP-N-acetylglucosamine diphosphorylase/glucosamine-1-phosphate N-acetyltransferase GlmU [Methylococcaceae bacterium]
MKISTIILAAGKGTRMRSDKPKVLHAIAHKPLLKHVYDMSSQLHDNTITIVYGHGGDLLKNTLAELRAIWTEQREQLGTGHAVQQAIPQIADADKALILYADVPLLKLATVERLLALANSTTLALLTVNLADPAGYGRIVRNAQSQVEKIVEEKDATAKEKTIQEVNTGIMVVPGLYLKKWLHALKNTNAQGEFYLTDIIEMAVADQISVVTAQPENEDEVLGVNNRAQLNYLERAYQMQQATALMSQGVTLMDASRFDLRGEILAVGQDVIIDVNVVLEGTITLGNNVRIGANCCIKNAVIADDVEILPNCVIEDAEIGAGSRVGPFARLRPGTVLAKQVHVGNFVEIKKSTVAQGSKVNHLSYIGDTTMGCNVNVGAGTITCNYDGVNKFRTVIEDNVFIGSNTQLVAPITIAKNATLGAGSTITKDAPENQLTLSRVKQTSIAGWQRPVKKESN